MPQANCPWTVRGWESALVSLKMDRARHGPAIYSRAFQFLSRKARAAVTSQEVDEIKRYFDKVAAETLADVRSAIGGVRVGLEQRIGGVQVELEQQIGGVRIGLEQEIGGLRVGLEQRIGGLRDDLQQDIGGLRDELQQDMKDVRVELKQEINEVRDELKQEIAGARVELRQEIAGVRAEVSQLRHENAAVADHLKEEIADVRRQAGAMAEDLRDEIRTVAEGVALVTARVDDVDLRIDRLANEMRRGFAGVRVEILRLHEADDELGRRIAAQEQRGA
jgi:hypothetical protein